MQKRQTSKFQTSINFGKKFLKSNFFGYIMFVTYLPIKWYEGENYARLVINLHE